MVFVIILVACYIIFTVSYFVGWNSTPYFKRTFKKPQTKVSIVIPVRNEEENIINCLNDLLLQDYPSELYEIIIVDDNSEDDTVNVIEKFISDGKNISIIKLNVENSGLIFKKNAIKKAVDSAKGDLIITTDADCRFNKEWLLTMVEFYEDNSYKMIVGPVSYCNDRSIFEKIQSLEFLSLIVSTGAAIRLKHPIMCNGANLAFEKAVFYEVGGYEKNLKYISGDDVFLMLKIKKKYKNAIGFIKSGRAIVNTYPIKDIRGLFNQRKRWVSKSKGYNDFWIIFIAIFIFIYNITLLVTLFNIKLLPFFALLIGTKIIFDFPLLYSITKFVKRKDLLVYYLPVQFIYFIYVIFIAIVGNIVGYKWKNRNV